MILSLFITVALLAAEWRLFQKMGRQGWEGIIPVYSVYIQFEILYGNGARMFLLLIPFYNLYVLWRYSMDLASVFNRTEGFGWGLFLLSPVFTCILGFGNAVFLDGSQTIVGDDVISSTLDHIADRKPAGADADAPRGAAGRGAAGTGTAAKRAAGSSTDALALLRELAQLHADGILTDEEFTEKKTELLRQI